MVYAGVKDDIHIVPLMCPFNLFGGQRNYGAGRGVKNEWGDYKGRVGDIPLKGTPAPFWEWGCSKSKDFLAAADNLSI